jgi:hypothetical protein
MFWIFNDCMNTCALGDAAYNCEAVLQVANPAPETLKAWHLQAFAWCHCHVKMKQSLQKFSAHPPDLVSPWNEILSPYGRTPGNGSRQGCATMKSSRGFA